MFPYDHFASDRPDFHSSRRSVASLERRLWEEAYASSFVMLNTKPDKGAPLDEELWNAVRDAFGPYLVA